MIDSKLNYRFDCVKTIVIFLFKQISSDSSKNNIHYKQIICLTIQLYTNSKLWLGKIPSTNYAL